MHSPSGGGPGRDPAAADAKALPRGVTVLLIGYVDVERGITPLAPLVAGEVAEVLVEDDQPVVKGQPLLKMDDTQAKIQVEQAEAAVAGAAALVAKAEQAVRMYEVGLLEQRNAITIAEFNMESARIKRESARLLNKINKSDVTENDILAADKQVMAAEKLVEEIG